MPNYDEDGIPYDEPKEYSNDNSDNQDNQDNPDYGVYPYEAHNDDGAFDVKNAWSYDGDYPLDTNAPWDDSLAPGVFGPGYDAGTNPGNESLYGYEESPGPGIGPAFLRRPSDTGEGGYMNWDYNQDDGAPHISRADTVNVKGMQIPIEDLMRGSQAQQEMPVDDSGDGGNTPEEKIPDRVKQALEGTGTFLDNARGALNAAGGAYDQNAREVADIRARGEPAGPDDAVRDMLGRIVGGVPKLASDIGGALNAAGGAYDQNAREVADIRARGEPASPDDAVRDIIDRNINARGLGHVVSNVGDALNAAGGAYDENAREVAGLRERGIPASPDDVVKDIVQRNVTGYGDAARNVASELQATPGRLAGIGDALKEDVGTSPTLRPPTAATAAPAPTEASRPPAEGAALRPPPVEATPAVTPETSMAGQAEPKDTSVLRPPLPTLSGGARSPANTAAPPRDPNATPTSMGEMIDRLVKQQADDKLTNERGLDANSRAAVAQGNASSDTPSKDAPDFPKYGSGVSLTDANEYIGPDGQLYVSFKMPNGESRSVPSYVWFGRDKNDANERGYASRFAPRTATPRPSPDVAAKANAASTQNTPSPKNTSQPVTRVQSEDKLRAKRAKLAQQGRSY